MFGARKTHLLGTGLIVAVWLSGCAAGGKYEDGGLDASNIQDSQPDASNIVDAEPPQPDVIDIPDVQIQDVQVQEDGQVPTVLLSDDFNSDINQWTAFLNFPLLEAGQWYWGATEGFSGSGALSHACCSGTNDAEDALIMYLGAGSGAWTDYRLEVKLRIGFGSLAGVWVRGQYQSSATEGQWVTGYYVTVGDLGDGTHTVRLLQLQTSSDCWGTTCTTPQDQYHFANPYLLQSVIQPGALLQTEWYILVVEATGNRIRVWFDGVQALDVTDAAYPFLNGTVGFKTYQVESANFDDLTVTELP